MDIDEYLKQKKSLEEQKKILEGKGKLKEENQKIEKKTFQQPIQQPLASPQQVQQPVQQKSGFSTKTLLIVNMIILLGVFGIFATFYLFPPGVGGEVDEGNELTGRAVVQPTGSGSSGTSTTTTATTSGNESEEENATSSVEYIGPDFDISITDSTEGPFDEFGKLQGTGNILSIRGASFYNDFTVKIKNNEPDKIVCAIDRKMDVDTDLDGRIDVEGVYSLDRHKLKMKPLVAEEIKAGIESVPGSVNGYTGKGEVRVEYEARCYFCLDERCETYEELGEESRKASFRVRINDHLFITGNSSGNQSS